MTTAKLFVSTLTTCLLAALPLAAQEAPAGPEVEAAAPVASDPAFRVDFQLPSVGLVETTAEGGAVQAGVGIRVAHQSGHGVRFDLSAWDDLHFFSAGTSAVSYDLSYFYRLRVQGNDRLGLGVDLGGGLSVQDIQFSNASWGGSTPVRDTVSDGAHLGGVLIAALDGRVYGFTFGMDVRAHSVFALQGQPGAEAVQADVSLNTSLGFGFY